MRVMALVLVFGAVLAALTACGGGESADPTATPVQPVSPAPPGPAPGTALAPGSAAARAASAGVSVTVLNKDNGGRGPFEFAPADFTFSVGQTVNFTIVAEATFHTFTVEDLGIDVELNAGETVDFSFTFDTPGTYKLFCIPHEPLGMVGTITVN